MESYYDAGYDLFDSIMKFVANPKFYIPIISIFICIILIIISGRIVKRFVNRNATTIELKRRNTIVVLLQGIIKYFLIIVTILIILGSWGFNVTGFITGLGIAGVVAGLALQDALKDIIMGCNIILDNYYVIGDIIDYNGFIGEVIDFGLKNTKIKRYDGTVKIIANRQISEIENLSQKSHGIFITIPTPFNMKNEKMIVIFNEICKEISKNKMCQDAELLGIDNFNTSSIDYLIRIKCSVSDRYALRRESLKIIKNKFDEEKIHIPYQVVEVHNGK